LIGVVGPKRMDYTRAISSVNYLASLLSESLSDSAL
jgi:transcriptional regulator of heat shock response